MDKYCQQNYYDYEYEELQGDKISEQVFRRQNFQGSCPYIHISSYQWVLFQSRVDCQLDYKYIQGRM